MFEQAFKNIDDVLWKDADCRLHEAASLRWRDVDFERKTLPINGGKRGTKNDETRTVPMTDALRTLLFRFRDERQPKPYAAVSVNASAKKCLQTGVSPPEVRAVHAPRFPPSFRNDVHRGRRRYSQGQPVARTQGRRRTCHARVAASFMVGSDWMVLNVERAALTQTDPGSSRVYFVAACNARSRGLALLKQYVKLTVMPNEELEQRSYLVDGVSQARGL